MIGRIKATTALWWFCIVVVAAMLIEFITKVALLGMTFVSGWWLIRKATSWLFSKSEKSHDLPAEKARVVVPTSVVFRKI